MLARLLFRCADDLGLSLEGCWYRGDWVSRGGATEPTGPGQPIYRRLRVPEACPALRQVFLARLRARRQRRLAAHLLKILGQQRRQLAHALHAGPCQTMTAAQLTLGLMEVAPDPETLQELESSVVRAGQELRALYEAQLCLFPEGEQQLYARLQIQPAGSDQLLFEMLLAAQQADPGLSVSQFENELLLEFTRDDDPDKIAEFVGALQARGDRVRRSGALVSVRS
ncbi:hypothetical protein JST97_37945 [bacterium]|nr:hypothetical protein [bacterium]